MPKGLQGFQKGSIPHNRKEKVFKQCLICKSVFTVHLCRKETAKFCCRKCKMNSQIGKILGKDHPSWKGDKVGYDGLHKWVKSRLGSPTKCEHCGKDRLTGGQIHWANKSHEYKRDVSDWLRLCARCHKAYDKNKIKRQYLK